ncbi:MAG: hypothetical protein C4555_05555 [Dehalococcoidia bacterium]|nr:MAG: hypothetical protein C4555_05555 [Dehalococcoidia bacterium]
MRKKKLWFAVAVALILLVSGGGFVYTYNNSVVTLGLQDPSGDIVTVTEAAGQPDWNSLVSANISGEVPVGDLYGLSPGAGYTGDLVVKAYLANTSALIKAYRYLNIKLYQEDSEEAEDTPDYRLLTLDNGIATFSLTATGFGLKSWTQTTQADFESGTLTNLDTASSPGDVKLAMLPPTTLASDDFESGGFAGGSGWLAPWSTSGNAAIVTLQFPYQGSYHLRLQGANGYVDRALDLSGQAGVHLQFWAKANSLEAGDIAVARVSPDGTTWTTVQSWTSADSDNTYHFYDIDLSGFTMSSQFRIAFDGTGMDQTNDYLYVDDVRLVTGGSQYYTSGEILSPQVNVGSAADFHIIYFTITEPSGTDIKFQLRSALTQGELASATWYGPTGTGDYYTTSGTAVNTVHDGYSWIQYRGVFSSDGSATPTLSDISVSYSVGGGSSEKMLSVVGGSYRKVSDNSSDWAEGWSITPEIYVEVVQR